MKKGYLVTLSYHDGSDYDAYTWEDSLVVFESEEEAKEFCKNNSDDEEFYYITKNRIIAIEGHKPIEIEFNDLYDPEDDNRERYWFVIDEICIIEKKGD